MVQAFSFDEAGRTFTCETDTHRSAGAQKETWWWVGVSGDANRYAPFRATDHDTRDSVQRAVITFYHNMLEARARPAAPRGGFGSRPRPVPVPVSAPSVESVEAVAKV